MTTPLDPKHIVRTGYDKVSHAYRPDIPDPAATADYLRWINLLHLPPNAPVLELGCGNGLPVARHLAPKTRYLGIDLSPVQIARAQSLVPAAKFQCADMTQLTFPPHSFTAIIALYSLIHLPLDEQLPLLQKIAHWLQPNGQLLAIVGATAWTGTEPNWLNIPNATMYWSHADAPTYRQWFQQCHLKITHDQFIPEPPTGHQLLLAQTPDPRPQTPDPRP